MIRSGNFWGLSFPLIQLIPLIPCGNSLYERMGPIHVGQLVFDVLVNWLYPLSSGSLGGKERHATATRGSLKMQMLQNIQT
jgi:hypothetical protein